jgi:hypothetical protein
MPSQVVNGLSSTSLTGLPRNGKPGTQLIDQLKFHPHRAVQFRPRFGGRTDIEPILSSCPFRLLLTQSCDVRRRARRRLTTPNR